MLRSSALSVLSVLVLALPAAARGPVAPFPDCAEDNLAACPNDMDWTDISWIPENARSTVRLQELAVGSGVHLDQALRWTAGSWDVSVAVIDSGIRWNDDQAASTVRLNQGELPTPQYADGTEVPDADLNGDGIHSIDDWAEDPRVDRAAGVDAADDRLDPSDLIATFSDGIDEDDNGYVDDIAGWDFYEGDNDPYAAYDQGFSSHGTGVMKNAAAWADDGGDLGACPNCAILPLRIGEAFVTDGDRLAQAIAYAADQGVGAVSMAVGGLTQPWAVEEAARYAEQRGVILVSAAGDENAWHRNRPAVASPILFVKSVRTDNRNEDNGAKTYTSTIHCNNFGPRLDLVAPSTACATGATGKIAGIAGLLRSADLQGGPPFATAPQLRAVLHNTADDIVYTAEDAERIKTFPAAAGRDDFYGSGRVNAGNAVQAVLDDALPPHVRLLAPGWFTWSDGTVNVWAEILDAPFAKPAGWVLEAGEGELPTTWIEVARGSGPVDGLLATVDLAVPAAAFASLTVEDRFMDRYHQAHQPLVQLRLRVSDSDGDIAEDRTAVWVHDDPDALEGWPVQVDGSTEAAPALADLDGDGVFEVIVASASGTVYALDGFGQRLPGWPVRTRAHRAMAEHDGAPAWQELDPLREGLVGQPAVGDIDGDGQPEVVVGTLSGSVYAWNHDGSEAEGFPVRIDGRPHPWGRGQAWDDALFGAPALADVDEDGALEIILGAGDQRLYVWHGDGRRAAGFPLELCSETCGVEGYRILSSAAVGDIDSDGHLEAVIGSNEVPRGSAGALYAVDLVDARIEAGFPIGRPGLVNTTLLPVIGEGHASSPALTDLDGDGDLEIVSAPMLGQTGLLHHDGTPALEPSYLVDAYGPGATYTDGTLLQFVNQPALGDLDGDGIDDYVVGGSSPLYLASLALVRVQEHMHGMTAFSGADGSTLPAFPFQVDSLAFLTAPAIADIDGNGMPEVLATSSGHLLHARDIAGRTPAGWPKFHGGWAMGGPAVGDIDGDGLLDVVLTTREGTVHAWRTTGPADSAPAWGSARHDAQNTGNATTVLPDQEGPSAGCCKGGNAKRGVVALLLLPLLLGLRRRRQG